MDEGVTEIAEGLKENSSLKELILLQCGIGAEGAIHLADALRANSALRVLDLRSNSVSTKGMLALAEALVGNKTIASFPLGYFYGEGMKQCSELLMEGNGSLVDCGDMFEDVCGRNRAMHNKAREAVQALRVLRWRQGEQSILHMIAKEVVKMIGVALWNTRTEIAIWATK